MRKNFLILHRDLSMGTGGAASLNDLSFNIESCGHNVFHAPVFFNIDSLRFLLKKKPKILNIGGLFFIKSFSLRSYLNYNRPSLKEFLRLTGSFLFYCFNILESKKFEIILADIDYVIHSLPLNEDILKIIKKKSPYAKQIYNHAGSVETFEKYWLRQDLFKKKQNQIYYSFFKQFNFIIFQSLDQLNCSNSRHEGLKSKNICLKPTCNENQINQYSKSKSPYDVNNINIVYVGTVCERKNQLFALKVFHLLYNSYDNCNIHFVGKIEKKYFTKLKAFSRSKNIEDRIQFHGYKPDYIRYIKHADIITLTSKSEGVSRILRESMFLKTPIIASKISGTIEILSDGCGYLVDGFNEKNFYNAFCDLIDNDFLKKEMVNLAFDRYNKVYSNKAYKKNLQNLLKLIDDKSK